MNEFTSFAEVVVVPITMALITAATTIFTVMRSNKKNSDKIKEQAEQFRVENTTQHNENKVLVHESKTLLTHLSNQITGIDQKVDRLDERLDNVQVWQAEHEKVHLNERMNIDNRDKLL